MADSLGSLVVSLSLESASFTDGLTKAAYQTQQSMGQIASHTGSVRASMASLVSSVDMAKTAIQGLIGLEVVHWFEQLATSTVASLANLQDLGVRVGSTAEQLSAFIPAAQLSGTSMDQVGTAAAMLEKNLTGIGPGSNRATEALAALGFTAEDAKRFLADPTEGIYELAQRLNEFQDDGAKTAATMALMGRGASEMLPFLKQLGDQTALVSTVTNEQAKAAHDLTDSWNSLKLQGQLFANSIAAEVIPALNKVIEDYKIARDAGEGIFDAWQDAKTTVSQMPQDLSAVREELEQVQDRLQKAKDAQTQFQTGTPGYERLREDIDKMSESIAALTQRLTALKGVANNDGSDSVLASVRAMLAPTGGNPTGTDILAGIGGPDPFSNLNIPVGSTGAPYALPHLQFSGAAAKPDTTFTSEMDALAAAAAKANVEMSKLLDPAPMTAAEEAFAQFVASDKWDKLTAQQKDAVAAKEMDVEATERQVAAMTVAAALEKELNQTNMQSIQAMLSSADSINQQTDSLTQQTATMGMSAAEIDDYQGHLVALTLAREQDKLSMMEMSGNATDAEIEAQQRIIAALENQLAAWNKLGTAQRTQDASAAMTAAAHQAEQAWKQASDSIDNDLTSAFDDWVHGAANLGQQLKDELLKMFDTLVLRPLLQPVAGDIAGLFTSGAPAASGGASGLASGALSLGSDFSSFANIGQTISAFPTAVSAFGADLSILGAGGGLDAIGGLSGLLSGAAPVLGPIGIALAIASAAGLFGSSHGPKSGGFAQTGSDFGRFYTPSGSDSTVATLANTTQAGYNSLLASLGGTGSANFAFGFDEDPNGTANSRVSAGATVNGKRVYSVLNQDAGRGDKGVQADLQLDAQRAILAALQASNLPKDIADILDSITPSSASLDQITQVTTLASAYEDLSKMLATNAVSDGLAAIAKQSEGAYGAFEDQGDSLRKLLTTYDGSTKATQDLQTASDAYYTSLVNLIAQIQQVKASIDDMFQGSIRKFQIDSLGNQGQYNFYQKEVGTLTKQLSTASDPEAVNAIETQINADLNAAFSLLDPSQRSALLSQYIAAANTAQSLGDARLGVISSTTTATFDANITQAQQAIKDAADSLKQSATVIATAAGTNATAANTNLQAARTPLNVSVTVTNNGATTAEVTGGA